MIVWSGIDACFYRLSLKMMHRYQQDGGITVGSVLLPSQPPSSLHYFFSDQPQKWTGGCSRASHDQVGESLPRPSLPRPTSSSLISSSRGPLFVHRCHFVAPPDANNMCLKDFNADVAQAKCASFDRVSDIRKGDCEGQLTFPYLPDTSHPIEIQALVQSKCRLFFLIVTRLKFVELTKCQTSLLTPRDPNIFSSSPRMVLMQIFAIICRPYPVQSTTEQVSLLKKSLWSSRRAWRRGWPKRRPGTRPSFQKHWGPLQMTI